MLLDLAFYWVTITSIFFSSSNTNFLFYMWLLHLKYIRSLEYDAIPFSKKGRNTNWLKLIYFLNHIKWDDICHYEWKFKIERWMMYSSEKKAKFHFKSETGGPSASTLLILSIYTPSSCTHTHFMEGFCKRYIFLITYFL